MTTRLIEECFEREELEEDPTKFTVVWTEAAMLIVVDPYLVNMPDLINAKPGSITLVRLRRPAWGRADLSNCIKVIRR